jgi:hypothetical protein
VSEVEITWTGPWSMQGRLPGISVQMDHQIQIPIATIE